MRSTLGMTVGVAAVLFTLHAGDAEGSRITCKRATAEAAATRIVMSSATRIADTKRAAFHACLERRKNKPQACGAERKAMRAAGTQQRNAVAAFNFANATKTKVCSPAR